MTSPLASPHEQALAPCPHCGCTDASINDNGHEEWVECDWCGATSGYDPAPEFDGKPITWHWNRRAALPAPDLAEWEKAAEGVTRGEWAVDGFNLAGVISRAPGRTHVSDWKHLAVCGNENSNWRKDAAWIARCSPDNVLSAFRSLSARLASVERERDATQELLTDLADTFERFLGDLGHPQDSWQRDQIALARKETPDAQ